MAGGGYALAARLPGGQARTADDDGGRPWSIRACAASAEQAFPAGLKWKLVRQQRRPADLMAVNGDEGEPGTFKDRYYLETRRRTGSSRAC